MPVYEFRCDDCGQKAEAWVRSFDEKHTCPRCGGGRTTRLLSTFNAHGERSMAADDDSGCASCPTVGNCPHNYR